MDAEDALSMVSSTFANPYDNDMDGDEEMDFRISKLLFPDRIWHFDHVTSTIALRHRVHVLTKATEVLVKSVEEAMERVSNELGELVAYRAHTELWLPHKDEMIARKNAKIKELENKIARGKAAMEE